jgi:hypothetical protein
MQQPRRVDQEQGRLCSQGSPAGTCVVQLVRQEGWQFYIFVCVIDVLTLYNLNVCVWECCEQSGQPLSTLLSNQQAAHFLHVPGPTLDRLDMLAARCTPFQPPLTALQSRPSQPLCLPTKTATYNPQSARSTHSTLSPPSHARH